MKIVNIKEEAEKLFFDNTGLVFFTLKKYYPTYIKNEDMHQEGFLALWKACLTYNENFNVKFSTYSVKVIHQHYSYVFRSNKELRCGVQLLSMDAKFISASGEPLTFGDMIIGETDVNIASLLCDEVFSKLKPREVQLLKLSFAGYKQAEIAKQIGVSRQYVNHLYIKLRKKIVSLK